MCSKAEVRFAGGENLLVSFLDAGHFIGIHHVVGGFFLVGAEEAFAFIVAEHVVEVIVHLLDVDGDGNAVEDVLL